MSLYNQDTLDMLNVLSLIIGIANYKENLTQSDKDDILKKLDAQTKDILQEVQDALEEQNCMLRKIIELLEGGNTCTDQ